MSLLYRQQIIDLYKNPLNFGELTEGDLAVEGENTLCGDRQCWVMKFQTAKIVEQVKWTGVGCVISMAAASLLSEEIKGKDLKEFESWGEEEVMELLGVKVNPGRIKCLMLSLETVKKALQSKY